MDARTIKGSALYEKENKQNMASSIGLMSNSQTTIHICKAYKRPELQRLN